jgi:hypothetical protein
VPGSTHEAWFAPALSLRNGGHVSCLLDPCRSRRGVLAFALVLSASCTPLATSFRTTRQYRAPAVVLAYPERGAALPADRAVVLFRFAPREPGDDIDVTSFKATVDGVDRTSRFRVTGDEAWGTLGDSVRGGGRSIEKRLTPGPHTVSARVCTERGVCGASSTVVDVRPWERVLAP